MRRQSVQLSLVGFIDLLGFADATLRIKTFSQLDTMKKKVKLIRSAFDHKSRDEATQDVQRMLNKKIFAFSDCVVISIPTEAEYTRDEGTFDTFGMELVKFAWGQASCALKGYFLRGGVDLGIWHSQRDIIVSPALVAAYRQEQFSEFPIISVTPAAFRHFRDHPHRKFYSKDADPFPSMFRTAKNSQGKTIRYLDYIEITLGSLNWQQGRESIERYKAAGGEEKSRIMEDGYRKNVEEWLTAHRRAILASHRSARIEKIRRKYRFLAEYHNEVVHRRMGERKDLTIAISDQANA